jgi:hypothetical protein
LQLSEVVTAACRLDRETIPAAYSEAIAVLLVFVLVLGPVAAMAQTPKEKLNKIPIGKVVEVKLLEKGSNKITGKLLSVSDEYFEIQTAQSGSISTQKISYDRVKSLKQRGMHRGYKALIWYGVGAAAGLIIYAVIGNAD